MKKQILAIKRETRRDHTDSFSYYDYCLINISRSNNNNSNRRERNITKCNQSERRNRNYWRNRTNKYSNKWKSNKRAYIRRKIKRNKI